MMCSKLYSHFSQLPIPSEFWEHIGVMPIPKNVLMVSPNHYRVDYVINPFMQPGTVDLQAAMHQWQALKDVFKQCGLSVFTYEGNPDCPDQVFTANFGIPHIDATFVPSQMRHAARQTEIAYAVDWFKNYTDYQIQSISDKDLVFEGQGDALWHPTRQLLWCGYGPRTQFQAVQELFALIKVPIVALELVTLEFYHLDTAISFMGSELCIYYPNAFSSESQKMIQMLIPNAFKVPLSEAKQFACNAFCIQNKWVVLPKGCPETMRYLKSKGFDVIEVDTSEFFKAGGSVSCMKLSFW